MNRFKIIVAERDCEDPLRATGAIVFEQYILSDDEVEKKAQRLADSGKLGRVWVAEVDAASMVETKATSTPMQDALICRVYAYRKQYGMDPSELIISEQEMFMLRDEGAPLGRTNDGDSLFFMGAKLRVIKGENT